jgi:hypothetical protein
MLCLKLLNIVVIGLKFAFLIIKKQAMLSKHIVKQEIGQSLTRKLVLLCYTKPAYAGFFCFYFFRNGHLLSNNGEAKATL